MIYFHKRPFDFTEPSIGLPSLGFWSQACRAAPLHRPTSKHDKGTLFVILQNIMASWLQTPKHRLALNLLVLCHCCLLGHLWARRRFINVALLTKWPAREFAHSEQPSDQVFISCTPAARRDRGSQSDLCTRSSSHWVQKKQFTQEAWVKNMYMKVQNALKSLSEP